MVCTSDVFFISVFRRLSRDSDSGLLLVIEPAEKSHAGIVPKGSDAAEKWMSRTFAGAIHAVVKFTVALST